MQITLPYTYEVTYRSTKGNRTTTASDAVSADVPTITREEMVPAADWRTSGMFMEVGFWNGELYRPLNYPRDARVTAKTLQSVSGEICHNEHRTSLERLYGLPFIGNGIADRTLMKALGRVATEPKRKTGEEFVSSTQKRRQQSAQDMAMGLVMVGNTAWHRIPGLMLSLFDKSYERNSVYIQVPPYGGEIDLILNAIPGIQNPTLSRYFGLNEFDRISQHSADFAVEYERLNVHLPEVFTFDGESLFAARFMNFTVRSSEYLLGSLGPEAIELWVGLRDVVAKWYGGQIDRIDAKDVDALVEFASIAVANRKGNNDWLLGGIDILNAYRADHTMPIPTLDGCKP